MTCLSDADEMLRGRKQEARMPRVTFYEGMQLREHGVATELTLGANDWVMLQHHGLQSHYRRTHLLDAIRDGIVTIEPTVGMRVELAAYGGVVRDVLRLFVHVETAAHFLSITLDEFHSRIRSGALAILPPEKESAKPVAVVPGLRLRSRDGAVHVVHPGDAANSVFLACGGSWKDYPREDVQEMIAAGQLTVIESPDAEPAVELETDPRILELEAACVERDQRIAELEARFVDARDAADEAEVRVCRAEGRADDAEARASAAEQKLADLVALGLDALPAMYPIIDVTVGCEGRTVLVYKRTNGDWTSSCQHSTSFFREALHAAVKAVGGKLPGDDAETK